MGGIPYTSRKWSLPVKNEVKVSFLAQPSETAVERSSIILRPDDQHAPDIPYSIAIEKIACSSSRCGKTLACVCRRWRCIVFASPGHLLSATARPPRAPNRISGHPSPSPPVPLSWHAETENGVEILNAAQHSDAICDGLKGFVFERFAAVMQELLPART